MKRLFLWLTIEIEWGVYKNYKMKTTYVWSILSVGDGLTYDNILLRSLK